MAAPRVSVIIATNRGGPYLEEAVASVRAQTAPVAEVVLVDDGSPAPGLQTVAESLGIDYLRQPASGVSTARNAGAARATGTWLAFLDDDDVWDPRRIERQLAALAAAPGAIASHTGGWHLDSDGIDLDVPWDAPSASSREMLAGEVAFPRIITLLVRRDVYLGIGGCDPTMTHSEDNDLMLRLLLEGEFASVDEPLVGYRRHARNVTQHTTVGWEASRRLLARHRRAARKRGDEQAYELLTANYRRFRANAADNVVGDVISAARRRDVVFGTKAAWWAATRVPAESVAAVGRRVKARRARRAPRDASRPAR